MATYAPTQAGEGWTQEADGWHFRVPPGSTFNPLQYQQLVIGRSYQAVFTVTVISGALGTMFFRPGSTTTDIILAEQDYDITFVADNSNGLTRFLHSDVTGVEDIRLSNLSIRDVTSSGPGIARNDAEFAWLGTQGALGGSLPDRRAAFFAAQGISTWREYYNLNGGTGHISDWLYALFTA
jgi:hypothetical protein